MHQIIKINIITNNIMEDPMIMIGKITINQIKITDIINEDIIKTPNFDRMVEDIFVVIRRGIQE
jgi:hypothetical protein